MAKYITVLIEYEDSAEQPKFCADMEVLGGKITAVNFGDLFKEVEELEAVADILTGKRKEGMA